MSLATHLHAVGKVAIVVPVLLLSCARPPRVSHESALKLLGDTEGLDRSAARELSRIVHGIVPDASFAVVSRIRFIPGGDVGAISIAMPPHYESGRVRRLRQVMAWEDGGHWIHWPGGGEEIVQVAPLGATAATVPADDLTSVWTEGYISDEDAISIVDFVLPTLSRRELIIGISPVSDYVSVWTAFEPPGSGGRSLWMRRVDDGWEVLRTSVWIQ